MKSFIDDHYLLANLFFKFYCRMKYIDLLPRSNFLLQIALPLHITLLCLYVLRPKHVLHSCISSMENTFSKGWNQFWANFFNVSEHMYKLIKRCLTEPLTLMQLVLLPFELAEIDCVERMLKASQIEFLLLHGQPPG